MTDLHSNSCLITNYHHDRTVFPIKKTNKNKKSPKMASNNIVFPPLINYN